MTFEEVPPSDALGAILAHSLRLKDRVLHKGTILTEEAVANLAEADIAKVHVARLEQGDITESDAAERLAARLSGKNLTIGTPTNGRVDLFAATTGVVTVDRAVIDAVNLAQSAIQLATLPEYALAEAGQIVATVKVVPFGVPADVMEAAEAAAPAPAVALAPLRPLRVGVVATETASVKPSVLEKTRKVLEERLKPSSATILSEIRVPHAASAVGEALVDLHRQNCELLIIFGASATSDPRDVVPAGIEAASGKVTRIGMPVDPGNLLVLGELNGVPVIGAPGCARSPAPSGFDWVLQRLLAGLSLSASDLAIMGVGGVLAEKRTQRVFAGESFSVRRRIDAIVLAAGASSRMRGPQKLLARIDGVPMVRKAVDAALASSAASVTVVVGHSSAAVREVIGDLDVAIVENPDYAEGLSTSVRAGVASLPDDSDGAIILLGDMPDVEAEIVSTIIDAFEPDLGRHVVVPTYDGKAGNPVLWSRRFFGELQALSGDMGAREMIRRNPDAIAWVKAGPAVTRDIDTPEALSLAGGALV